MSELMSSLPLHITSDILLRLHAESVVRSRYVSKLWSSITNDPYFTNTFETRSSTRPSLLMFFKKKDKLFVYSFPQHNNENSKEPHQSYFSQHVEYSYQMKYPKDCSFSLTESVNGLICFRKAEKPLIWNPSRRQFLTLPKPEKKWKAKTVFLGYDPIEGKHKVVCMPSPTSKASDECRVFTLGSAKLSWRTVKTSRKHLPLSEYSYGRCINGVLYYKGLLDDSDDVGNIISFDVRTEKFNMIPVPSDDSWDSIMAPYEGKLAFVNIIHNNDGGIGITLWILEDAEKQEWLLKHFVTPFHPTPRSKKTYKIDGITETGEIVCVPVTLLNSFSILYFDPVRNSLRTVEFKGIADEGFRFSNGLGNKRLCKLYTFPNHIETLISL